jgi:ankyrin repeat protein
MPTSLREAIRSNDPTVVARVLDEQPELKSSLNEPLPGGAFGGTALLVAVGRANRDVIDVLLRAGADINQKSHWWAGPFGVMDEAWRQPWLPAFLMERGARLEIHAGVRLGMTNEVRRMLDRDPLLIHARGGDGQLPLHFAQTTEMADLLLAGGADIDARDIDHESTAAQWMVKDRREVARHLVERGASYDILLASAIGDVNRVRTILDRDPGAIGTTVSAEWFPMRDSRAGGTIYIWTIGSFETPYSVARESGHDELYGLLIDRTPASVKPDHPALVRAAFKNDAPAVRALLSSGWDANSRVHNNVSALHWAAFHGNAAMTRDLVAHGAAMDVKDGDFGGDPLGWAIHGSLHGWHPERGHYAAVVEALLDAGAQPPSEPRGSDLVQEVLRRRGRR